MKPSVLERPRNLRARPLYNNYVVPYFVAWYDAKGTQRHESTPGAVPSFPTIDMRRRKLCLEQGFCWMCGKQLGAFKAFVFGPASAIAGIAVEPPSHRDCALYAVQVCPFMVFGRDHKAHGPLRPGEVVTPLVSTRNPELAVVYITRSFTLEDQLIRVGPPENVSFWHLGKPATRTEIARLIARALEDCSLHTVMTPRDIGFAVAELMRFAPELEILNT